MSVTNLYIVQEDETFDIHIQNNRIVSTKKIVKPPDDATVLSFNNTVVFPGIINSHDHLDFNLFPQLGSGVHEDYTEWAKHIHTNYKHTIEAVLQIPQALRIQWGLYKNLICGVTTVINHGLPIDYDTALIDIFQDYQSLHSVAFEDNWRLKLNNPFNLHQNVGIHIGEGTSLKASNEIDKLINNNYLKRRLIGVHGVAMTKQQARHFEALVWCPASNYFMFNKTAAVDKLKAATKIVFGSDSTLTSDWNIWQHIHLAQQTGLLTNEELFNSLTSTPASVWKLKDTGKIEQNFIADIIVANKKKLNNIDAALAVLPEDILLVIKNGVIKLFDACMLPQLKQPDIQLGDYSSIHVEGCVKYVSGNITKLMSGIKEYYPQIKLPVSIAHSKETANVNAF
ncbi:amidohydrolase family protein [Chitinophagaceae bacterium LWZ2-11]